MKVTTTEANIYTGVFIIEINSHPCNEYTIQNYKHQGL